MIKIFIISDSYQHFDKSIQEYQKRLSTNIELIKIKPVKLGDIVSKETDLIIKYLDKQKGYKIVLNPLGNNLDTNNFSSLIENKKIEHKHIILIIGGAYGLNYKKLKSYIDLELNISKFTLPHSLALLVLLEQLYRINMIKKGSNYHK